MSKKKVVVPVAEAEALPELPERDVLCMASLLAQHEGLVTEANLLGWAHCPDGALREAWDRAIVEWSTKVKARTSAVRYLHCVRRAKEFLALLRSGRFAAGAGVRNSDLLPEGHPQRDAVHRTYAEVHTSNERVPPPTWPDVPLCSTVHVVLLGGR